MLTRKSVVTAVPLLAAAACVCVGGGGGGEGAEYSLLYEYSTLRTTVRAGRSEKCNTLVHSLALHNKAVFRDHNYFSTKYCSYLHRSCRSGVQELRADLCWRAGGRRWRYLLNSEHAAIRIAQVFQLFSLRS